MQLGGAGRCSESGHRERTRAQPNATPSEGAKKNYYWSTRRRKEQPGTGKCSPSPTHPEGEKEIAAKEGAALALEKGKEQPGAAHPEGNKERASRSRKEGNCSQEPHTPKERSKLQLRKLQPGAGKGSCSSEPSLPLPLPAGTHFEGEKQVAAPSLAAGTHFEGEKQVAASMQPGAGKASCSSQPSHEFTGSDFMRRSETGKGQRVVEGEHGEGRASPEARSWSEKGEESLQGEEKK